MIQNTLLEVLQSDKPNDCEYYAKSLLDTLPNGTIAYYLPEDNLISLLISLKNNKSDLFSPLLSSLSLSLPRDIVTKFHERVNSNRNSSSSVENERIAITPSFFSSNVENMPSSNPSERIPFNEPSSSQTHVTSKQNIPSEKVTLNTTANTSTFIENGHCPSQSHVINKQNLPSESSHVNKTAINSTCLQNSPRSNQVHANSKQNLPLKSLPCNDIVNIQRTVIFSHNHNKSDNSISSGSSCHGADNNVPSAMNAKPHNLSPLNRTEHASETFNPNNNNILVPQSSSRTVANPMHATKTSSSTMANPMHATETSSGTMANPMHATKTQSPRVFGQSGLALFGIGQKFTFSSTKEKTDVSKESLNTSSNVLSRVSEKFKSPQVFSEQKSLGIFGHSSSKLFSKIPNEMFGKGLFQTAQFPPRTLQPVESPRIFGKGLSQLSLFSRPDSDSNFSLKSSPLGNGRKLFGKYSIQNPWQSILATSSQLDDDVEIIEPTSEDAPDVIVISDDSNDAQDNVEVTQSPAETQKKRRLSFSAELVHIREIENCTLQDNNTMQQDDYFEEDNAIQEDFHFEEVNYKYSVQDDWQSKGECKIKFQLLLPFDFP